MATERLKPTRRWSLRDDGRIDVQMPYPLMGCGAKVYVIFTVQELEAFITELQEALIAAWLEEAEDV